MQTTMNLLERALAVRPMPEWTTRLSVHRNALRNARERGHLTPVLAGSLALELDEDPEKWITLAVLEGEKESPAKEKLLKRLARRVRSYFNRTVTLGFRGKKPQRQPQQAARGRASSPAC